METAITQSVEGVGPADDRTVSGTGFFITDSIYILTNNPVVQGTQV